MSFASPPLSSESQNSAPGPSVWGAIWRAVLLTVGLLLLAVGFVGALLPGHLGVPLLIIGLILVLRTSRPARKRFIRMQRRHPNVVFPIRRLLRREPEVIPVFWQQVLRLERRMIPQRWRVAKVLRRKLLRRVREARAAAPRRPLTLAAE
ncbi:hypothetical protein [Phenylobacterium sp.]|uniref:hypothetical protein n=1 Tax=Phenylobacterium sp. TaxID=1871053 RepID=UPI002F401923